jgi:hypothetical protein
VASPPSPAKPDGPEPAKRFNVFWPRQMARAASP